MTFCIYKKIIRKIRTLAQENARYLVTVFMPTEMVYSTTLRQINYIASWMQKYIDNVDKNNQSINNTKSSNKKKNKRKSKKSESKEK